MDRFPARRWQKRWIWRGVAVLGVGLAFFWVQPGVADACSCMAQEPPVYIREADQVFIGRASEEQTLGANVVRRVEVLVSLKGAVAGGQVVTRRPANEGGGCDRIFTAGEVALVFVKKGKIEYCDGNVALSTVLPRMHEYLAAIGGTAAPTAEVVAHSLTKGLLGRVVPSRGRVGVVLGAHQGKSVDVGSRTYAFVGPEKSALVVKQATTRGPLHYFTVEEPGKGATIHVLLRQGKKGPELLAELVVNPPGSTNVGW